MKSPLLALAALLLFPAPSFGKKIGLVFNGGGNGLEGRKNERMERESVSTINHLKAAGYDFSGNIFLTDGKKKAGLAENSNAGDGKAFLDRVGKVCQAAGAGDEIFVSLSGHGEMPGGGPLENAFVSRFNAEPLDSGWREVTRKDPELLAAVRGWLEFRRNQSLSEGRQGKSVLDEMQKAAAALSKAVAASFPGKFSDKEASGLVERGLSEFDTLGGADRETVEKICYYLTKAAELPPEEKSGRPGFLKYFRPSSAGNFSVAELKEALSACRAKGIRMKISGTNCYSGGLLELTGDGTCAVSITNAYSTSIYSDKQPQLGSGGDSLAAMKRNMRAYLEGPDATAVENMNNDPQDSTDLYVGRWIASLKEGCRVREKPACVKEKDFEALCRAMGEHAPDYSNANAMGVVNPRIPAGLLALSGTEAAYCGPMPDGQIRDLTKLIVEMAEETYSHIESERAFLQGLGVDWSGIETESDLQSVVEAQFADPAAFRKKVDELMKKPEFIHFIPAGRISEQLQKNNPGAARMFLELMVRDLLNVDGRQAMQEDRYANFRKQAVYREMFRNFAVGDCREQYWKAEECVNESLSAGSVR